MIIGSTRPGAAVIGSGFIGTVHIEALRRIGVRVVGLLESSPELGERRARELSIPKAYASLGELLADPEVAVVHVTTPNELHHAQAKAILAAGRHVICEKPLALTSEESRELADLAAGSGLVNAVNFNIRWYPLSQHAAAAVAAGDLGEVRLVTGRYLQDWLLYDTDWNWRLEGSVGGTLRAVADIGSHWLDLTSFITGLRVDAVMAELTTFIPVRRKPTGPVQTFSGGPAAETVPVGVNTEDAASILIRYEGGARGCLTVSQVSPGRKNSLAYEVDGSSSSLAWDSESPDAIWVGHRGRANELLMRDAAVMHAAANAATRLPAGHAEGFADAFASGLSAVYADVAAGRPSEQPRYATFAAGHEEMLIGDAVLESSRAGAWAKINRG